MPKLLAIADPHIPVPPKGYGGTERVLFEALDGLADRGYDITLLGHSDSIIKGHVIGYQSTLGMNKLKRGWVKWQFRRQLRRLLPHFDILHAVGRLDYLKPALQSSIPIHYLFQNPIRDDQVVYLKAHCRGKLVLSACGQNMTLAHRAWGNWRPIHNATNVSRFSFHEKPQSPHYLAFLGRLTANKGVKEAIQIARMAGIPLHLAGNISNEPGGEEYFQKEVKPHIDGYHVVYFGEMNDQQKQQHLGGAIALINPVQWDEPFGIVTIEALACGTPVLACSRGELPFIIEEGVTGFLSNNIEILAGKLNELATISRERCRQEAVERFSTQPMVVKYFEVMQWLLSNQITVPDHWQMP